MQREGYKVSVASESDTKEGPLNNASKPFNPFQADNQLFQLSKGRSNGVHEGKPYHGPSLDLKKDDPEEKQPQLRHKAHIRQFDLTNPEHLALYEAVCQCIFDGGAILSFEDRVYDQELKSWRVLMRWTEIYYGTPAAYAQAETSKHPSRKTNG